MAKQTKSQEQKEIQMISAIIADNHLKRIYAHLGAYIQSVEYIADLAQQFFKEFKGYDWELLIMEGDINFPACTCWEDIIISWCKSKLDADGYPYALETSLIYPTFFVNNIEEIEIAPIEKIGEDENGKDIVEQTDNENDAHYWSVYVRGKHDPSEPHNVVDCIADCSTKEEAEELQQLLTNVISKVDINSCIIRYTINELEQRPINEFHLDDYLFKFYREVLKMSANAANARIECTPLNEIAEVERNKFYVWYFNNFLNK